MILYTPTSFRCSKDYMRLYIRNRLISEFGSDRLCGNINRGDPFELYLDFMTVYFHTDGSGNGGSGLSIIFTAIGKL